MVPLSRVAAQPSALPHYLQKKGLPMPNEAQEAPTVAMKEPAVEAPLPVDGGAVVLPTHVEAFVAPAATGRARSKKCAALTTQTALCEGKRCFRMKKDYACVSSPFDKTAQRVSPKWLKAPPRAPVQDFWALELADGQKCVGRRCPKGSVERTWQEGPTWFALIKGEGVRVERLWP